MAEDQGKDEEKFDFTGEGEAIGYISLAQARVLAMQTARETPGEYGSQYQGVSMAFEVVVTAEEEDYYTITLSFRPQERFSGTAGWAAASGITRSHLSRDLQFSRWALGFC